MYKHVLVPVALGHEDLVDRKIELARSLLSEGGKITLLTVLEDVPGFVAEFVTVKEANHLSAQVKGRLDELAKGSDNVTTDVVKDVSSSSPLLKKNVDEQLNVREKPLEDDGWDDGDDPVGADVGGVVSVDAGTECQSPSKAMLAPPPHWRATEVFGAIDDSSTTKHSTPAQQRLKPQGQKQNEPNIYSYFQAADGSPVFIHSLNLRCLLHEYHTIDNCPKRN